MTNKSTNARKAPAAAANVEATTDTVIVGTPTSNVAEIVKSLRGTPTELMERGVRLNGKLIDGPSFTFLRKFAFGIAVDIVGHVEKPQGQKGKPAEILLLKNAENYEFGFNPIAA